MTRVLALAGQSKIGCITQRRFAKVGTKTHPQRGAALDRNGLSVSTETACRFEPKSPVGNSEICSLHVWMPEMDKRLDGRFAPNCDIAAMQKLSVFCTPSAMSQKGGKPSFAPDFCAS